MIAKKMSSPNQYLHPGFPPPRRWYEKEVSTFDVDAFLRIVALVAATLGVDHEFVNFESDFVRDLGASEERREAVVRVLELAYDTTFPEAIRATITTPISAYIALARMGKIDDEEAKQN